MRVRPYRPADNRIDGAVLQLLDVSDLKAHAGRGAACAGLCTGDRGYRPASRWWCSIAGSSSADATSVLRVRRACRPGRQGTKDFRHGTSRSQKLPRYTHTARAADAGRNRKSGTSKIEYDTARRQARDVPSMPVICRSQTSEDRMAADLILLAFEDVTERKRAAEARYRRLFESARRRHRDTRRGNGEITDINPYTEKLTGYRRDEIVGPQSMGSGDALRNQPGVQALFEELADREY